MRAQEDNGDGPTKKPLGPSPPRWLVRTGGIWGNHLARRVKPQHLKIASCKRAHPAASLTRSLYIYRSILNSSHGRRCCAVQAIGRDPELDDYL